MATWHPFINEIWFRCRSTASVDFLARSKFPIYVCTDKRRKSKLFWNALVSSAKNAQRCKYRFARKKEKLVINQVLFFVEHHLGRDIFGQPHLQQTQNFWCNFSLFTYIWCFSSITFESSIQEHFFLGDPGSFWVLRCLCPRPKRKALCACFLLIVDLEEFMERLQMLLFQLCILNYSKPKRYGSWNCASQKSILF